MQTYNVYHATTKEKGSGILKSGEFICSKGKYEWLGHGVYFWKNKYTATDFWPKARKIDVEEACILKADLIVNSSLVLDLDEEDQYVNFITFCKDLKSELIAKNKYIPLKNEKEKWCFYSNYFKKRYEIALFIRTFPGYGQSDVYSVNRKQFCVTEDFKSIIKNIKEVV
ncbi:hypothetical protein [Peptoniphilus gorbachii]|uniref:Uncharacterized protein n=1 Tax=Peptoniphilus gorbachii TaxID=411567 RepID=A0ABS2MKD7_9FIRM|nr:hypothetical protein [Peptoniphilus gorbachii]MBM7550491.1 hypothetical protein [Peptoniphilus gorbachii]MDU1663788.1 hypothetical protein [Peptoniphilus harei]CAG7592885.1 hypothetical protein PEPTYR26121_01631 [Peptoniphilus tyrrelliae]